MNTVESSIAFISSIIPAGIDSPHNPLSSRMKGWRLAGFIASAAAIAWAAAPVSYAATIDWKSAPTNTTWATGTNWDGGTAPANSLTTDIARFNKTGYTSQPNAGTTSIAGIEIGDGTTATAALTLSGTNLSIGASGITKFANSGTAAISSNVTLGAAQSWTNNSSTLLTVSGNVTNAGYVLTIGGSGNTTLSTGVVSGAGGIIKSGDGTLSMTGNNTGWSGGITIKSGTVSQATNAASLGTGTITLGDSSGSSNATLIMSGTLTAANAITVAAGSSGTLRITMASGLGSPSSYTGAVTLNNQLTLGNLGAAPALNFGAGGITGSSDIIVDSAGAPVIINGTNNAIWTGNLIVQAGTAQLGANTSAPGVVSIGSGATFNFANNSAAAVRGIQDYSGGGGTVTSSGGGSRILTVNGNGTYAFSGNITSGPSANGFTVALGAAGKQILSGSNSYGGATAINSGILNIRNDSALGTTVGSTTVASGATLQLEGGITVGNETLTINGLGAAGQNGVLVNVSGTNSYGGQLTMGSDTTTAISSDNSGTLNLTNTGIITNTNNRTLMLTGSGNGSLAGVLIANGAITKNGTGTWALTGASTYNGTTTVNSGILNIRNGSALGTTVGSTTVASGATLQLEGGITVGNETLTINGLGAAGQNGVLVNVSGTNSYGGQLTMGSNAGGTAISSDGSGTLNLTNTGTITNGNNRTLILTGSGNGSLAGVLAAAGAITKNGTGTWTLTGTNTYSGATTVSAGTLQIGNGGTTGALSSASAISNNGTLVFNRTNDVVQGTDFSAAAITGTGNLTQSGTGNLTLNAANSYTGVTKVSAGNLILSNSLALQNSTLDTLNSIAGTATAGLKTTVTNLTLGGLTGDKSLSTVFTTTSGGYSGNLIALTINPGTAVINSYSGDIADGAVGMTLTKTGNGTQILSGNNTYTGTTTITAGTLQIGNGGTTGTFSSSSAITNNANLLFNRSNTITQGSDFSAISGTGNVTQVGSGTTILASANTYTGTTRITAGTLQIGNGGVTGSLSASSAITNNGTLTINRGNTVAQGIDFSTAAITGTGSLTQAGTGTTTLNATNSYTGVTTVERGTLSFTSGNASATGNQALGANATVILGVASTSSGTLNYNGAAGTLAKNVIVLGNGSDTIQNNGTGLLTLSGNLTKDGTTLTLKGGSNGITVSGAISGSSANSDLIIDGGTTTLTNPNNTYNGPTSIINGATLSVTTLANGGLASSIGSATNVASNLVLGGGTLLYNGTTVTTDRGFTAQNGTTSAINVASSGATLTISGSSANSTGALTKNGNGTLILSGSNGYTGATSIEAGALQIGNAGTTGSLSVDSSINIGTNSTLVFNRTNTATQGADFSTAGITGTGNLTHNGTGTVVLTAENTYTGTTRINVGTLQIGNGSATGSLSPNSAIVNNGTLVFNRTDTVTQGTDFSTAAITGTGSFTQAGSGTTTLNATNSYTGVTTVERGTLSFTSGNASATANQALGANATVILGVASISSGTLNYTSAAGTLAKNVIVLGNGSDTIQNSGTGLLTLSGNVTNAGNVLTIGGSGNTTLSTGAVSGTGGIIKSGDGTLSMTGTNTGWSGGITIKSGTVSQATNAASLGTGTITLGDSSGSSNATLMIASALTVANPITVAAGSSGTLRITVASGLAASSYTGAVTLNNQLTLGNLGASGANTLTIGVGGITGSSDIVVDSAGNPVVIAGTNNATWTGNLIVKAGTAQLGGNAAVPGIVSIGSGATFSFGTGGNVSGLQDYLGAGGNVTTNTSKGYVVNGNGTYLFSGSIIPTTVGDTSNALTVALGSAGKQILSGSNSYGGATSVNSGILNIRNDSALGTTGTGTSVASGATLQLEGGITVGNETLTINGLGATGQNAALVNVSGNNTYGGLLTWNAPATLTPGKISSDSGNLALTNTGTIVIQSGRSGELTGSGNGSIAGVISAGAGGLIKNGTGTWTLTGASIYTGITAINAGRLQLGDGNSTGSLSASSAIVNNATLTINRNNAVAQGTDFSTAAITGTGSFTQAGTGTTTLNATNSYGGVTRVERGTLSFTSGAASATANQALGANATVILGLASTSSGTLNYTGAAGTLAKNVNVLGTGSDTIQNSGTGLLTLSGNVTKNGTTLTLKGGSHGINVTGAISGSNANSDLIIDGGTTTLTNANNTYNGPTFIINGATLNASVVGALPTSTLSAVTINGTGSTLALGASQSVASLSGTSGASVNLNANTLTINGSSTTTYSGGISGTGNLVKNGSGTTTLNAANTYTGTTTVNSGTLAAAATNALGNSTVINVTGGSFLVTAANAVNDNANINLGGTLALNGTFNEAVGLLTLSANSVIDLDGFTGILRFGGVGSWASNTTLAIWNWNGINGASNRHVVFTNNSGLPNYLDRISFYSGSGSGFAGTGFEEGFTGPGGGTEIIAVPETETYFYAVALLAGLVIQYIRRRAKRKVCRLRLKSDPRLNRSATTVAVTITADAHPLA